MSRLTSNTKQTIYKGALFCAPFLLFFAAVLCFVFWLNYYFTESSAFSEYYEAAFQGQGQTEDFKAEAPVLIESSEPEGDYIEGAFVTPAFGSQWATMNVDGWEQKNLPVYYGNSTEVLRAGVAQAQFSRFSGQGGKVVLSAHVNREFYEIEDSARRFEAGEEVLVTLDTKWGKYVYRVSEVVIFGHLESAPLLPEEGEESLFFYTCYPRENSLDFKTQRIGLRCELLEGATWRDYVE